MITVKDFMEVVDYRITEGGDYGWQCYGPNAYRLDSWSGDQDGHSVSIVFDNQTQTVYEVTAYDYSRERAYRLINPDHREAHANEAVYRGVEANEAWDDVNYVDLESDDDFIQKALAIVAGEDYDTRVSIPLELPEDVLFELMRQAHENDITFNQHVENIVREACERILANNKNVFEEFFEDDFEDLYGTPAKMKAKKKKK
jgi:hypothetical protein